jgi:glycosyltransferase involved in cell wall biosynthesis
MAQEKGSDGLKTMLIFEPQPGGHRAGFLRWLREEIKRHPRPDCCFVFFTAENLSEEQAVRLSSAGRWQKQRILYSLFLQACRQARPDHVLIMELTSLELPLALFGSPTPLSAILFVQYPELSNGLKFFFKHWKTALLLRRAPVTDLFLLNGEKSCRFLTDHFSHCARFIPIPDPAPNLDPDPEFALREKYGIDSGRTVFLFFGAVSERKGSGILLDALKRLAPDAAARSAFLFCGEPEPAYREQFAAACCDLRAARPDIVLRQDDRFVPDNVMMALFKQADVVLMPYIRPEYSSGILALAAKAGKPVIGPDAGLLKRLIQQNGLGMVCPVTPDVLAESIAAAAQNLPVTDESKRNAFVQKSNPEQFARKILNSICDEC